MSLFKLKINYIANFLRLVEFTQFSNGDSFILDTYITKTDNLQLLKKKKNQIVHNKKNSIKTYKYSSWCDSALLEEISALNFFRH